MSGPATARWADEAWQGTVTIDENVQLARDTFRVRFTCPEIAHRIVPGQFVMLRIGGRNDPLLARPLALYDTVLDTSGEPIGIDVVYLVVGKMTSALARMRAGQSLEVWGPLGNGFAPHTHGQLIMVAGGIGQTPFMAMAREALSNRGYGHSTRLAATQSDRTPTLLYGARNKDYLAGVQDFQSLGVEVQVSTDDGSAGHHGFVTDLLDARLRDATDLASLRVVCCGPEPMMQAVARMTAKYGVRCEVSLETPMACGIGICFSCVAKVRQVDPGEGDGQWDYRRTCVEGPIFDAASIVFD
jgi:dihydroorotate dehydrogenase electron transfer subunit